jgi:hypothetical protein
MEPNCASSGVRRDAKSPTLMRPTTFVPTVPSLGQAATRWRVRSTFARLVLASCALACVVAIATFSVTVRFTGSLIWSDGVVYFLYARALVLDRSIDITEGYDLLDKRFPAKSEMMGPVRRWSVRDASGKVLAAWPAGAGIALAPFYAVGYAVERARAALSGGTADSLGLIPQYFFGLGSVAYALLGYWAMLLVSRAVAGPRAAYVSSTCIVFASPLIFYVFVNPSMAHAVSFGLVAVLTLLWWRAWNTGPRPAQMAAMGLILGALFTIRYQNALFAIMLVALAARGPAKDFGTRLRACALGAAACLVPIVLVNVPSFLAAQHGARLAIADGVLHAGAYAVDMSSPFFVETFFSCRQGTFYWSPVLAAGLVGLAWAALKKQAWPWPLVLTVLAHGWLIGGLRVAGAPEGVDWNHHWDGATSFGMRYMVECIPLLAIGLSVLVRSASTARGRMLFVAAGACLVGWNALLILAYALGTISHSYCVTYPEMVNGVARAVAQFAR